MISLYGVQVFGNGLGWLNVIEQMIEQQRTNSELAILGWIRNMGSAQRMTRYGRHRKVIIKDEDDRISEDELAPGVRLRYRVHSGRAYITGIQEWVITDWDRKHHEPGWSWITDLLQHDVITTPSHIDGFPVYSIDINPFLGFQKLVVASDVVEIGNYGGTISGSIGVWDDDVVPFRLHEVVLPKTIRYIRKGTFDYVEEVLIPEGGAGIAIIRRAKQCKIWVDEGQ